MATQLQLRKGTKVQNDAFTGAEGELTYDSTSKGLRLHDGVQQGGYIVDTVVAWQAPTTENNYTWYRKYASGWVEQGGCYNSASETVTVSFPIQMADTNYTILKTMQTSSTGTPARYFDFSFANKTTTSAQTNSANVGFSWQVSGMAA